MTAIARRSLEVKDLACLVKASNLTVMQIKKSAVNQPAEALI